MSQGLDGFVGSCEPQCGPCSFQVTVTPERYEGPWNQGPEKSPDPTAGELRESGIREMLASELGTELLGMYERTYALERSDNTPPEIALDRSMALVQLAFGHIVDMRLGILEA